MDTIECVSPIYYSVNYKTTNMISTKDLLTNLLSHCQTLIPPSCVYSTVEATDHSKLVEVWSPFFLLFFA